MSKHGRHNQARMIAKTLRIGWQQRPAATSMFLFGAALETGSFVGTLYASAKLSALLAHYVTTKSTADIWQWLFIDIACGIGIALGFWLMTWARRLIYFGIVQWSTKVYQEAMCRLDIPDYYDNNIRNQINKVQSGYTWQMSNLNESALDLVYALLRFAVTAVVVANIAWWLIPITALFLIPTLFSERRLASIQWFVWDEKGDNRHIFWGLDFMLRQAKNQMELRSSQAHTYVLRKLNRMTSDFYSRQESEVNRGFALLGPTKIIEASSTVIGAVVLLKQFLHGVISLQQYFFLSGALLRIGGSLNTVFSTLARLQEPLIFADDFFALTSRKSVIVDQPHACELTSSPSPPTIEFRNVSFTYPKQTTPVLEGFNLSIRPGQHLAIVGENGVGKSTLIKLLLRFYEPTTGQILINGVDVKDIAIDSWYSQLATLFQEFNQYPADIKENISIGKPNAPLDEEKLKSSAQLASVDTLVAAYKHGWETVLDNSFKKGIEPSGGQWQRVALARVFYRDTPVLILDEPTSAIDAKAEYDIFNNIFARYKNRTAIIVSHRFSTVRRADRIVVIDHGKIIEDGTHEKLMKRGGLYHDLFTKQAEGYM